MISSLKGSYSTETYGKKFYIDLTEKLYPEHKSEQEATFISRHFGLDGTQRLLDIPCGYGRLSRRLAPMVDQVVGVDLSAENIDYAVHSFAERGITNAQLLRQDMRHYRSRNLFDAIIVSFTSFGLFDRRDNLRFLGILCANLKIGGKLYMDVLNKSYFSQKIPITNNFIVPSGRITDHLSWLGDGRLQSIREYESMAGTSMSMIEVQTYDKEELTSMFTEHDLCIDHIYSSYLDEAFHANTDKMLVFATKVWSQSEAAC